MKIIWFLEVVMINLMLTNVVYVVSYLVYIQVNEDGRFLFDLCEAVKYEWFAVKWFPGFGKNSLYI